MSSAAEEGGFMNRPLVKWFQSCIDHYETLTYENLLDGLLLYQVLLKIDPEPPFTGIHPTEGVLSRRIKNLEIILKNLQTLYRDELGQTLIFVPDIVRLGADTNKSPEAQNDLLLLILLLLAFAVQCPNKEHFINKITSLPIDTQHAIVEHIKQLTDTAEIVLGNEAEQTAPRELLLQHLRKVVDERDSLLARCLVTESSSDDKKAKDVSNTAESHHFAVELADWKAKFRRQRQELEEKTEALTEAREEAELLREANARLRAEVAHVVAEARTAKAYRDEVDAMREKAERAEQLDLELQRFKDKLSDVEFYKARVQELRDDNRVLIETRETLEEQLDRAKRRAEAIGDLEAEIVRLKQQYNDLILERESQDKKLEDLYRERAELQLVAAATHRTVTSDVSLDSFTDISSDDTLSSQLTSNATARALRLELENRKLLAQMEEQREAGSEMTRRLAETEREVKRLGLTLNQSEENIIRLKADNADLHALLNESLASSKQLQSAKEAARNAADRLQEELTAERDAADTRQVELQRLRSRVEEMEGMVGQTERLRDELEEVRRELERVRGAHEGCGKELGAVQREIGRMRRAIEEKDREIDELKDRLENLTKQRDNLKEEVSILKEHIQKLHQVERENEEFSCKLNVCENALTVLEENLVQQKVENQKLKVALEKVGIKADQLLLATDERSLQEVLNEATCRKCSGNRMANEIVSCQQCAELAPLQVRVASLQSQNTSLAAQHTALQLANTQLVAEKEQVEEERRAELAGRQQLMSDLASLRQLHEQLSAEHEALKVNYDKLRASHRDIARDVNQLREDSRSLANLRAEHSRLREDFKELFGSNQELIVKYKAMQDHLKNTRLQNCANEEKLAVLRQEIARSDTDRRSVMEHANTLLAQFQDLFANSLEDKEHFHQVEKNFVDKLNEVKRQKEKLEEKIMDQYRKLENSSSKKRGLGATLVQKVRKASTDLINKGRRGWNEETNRQSIVIRTRHRNGSESGGNESDGSVDDRRGDETTGQFPHILKQQGAGTRQTVYYTEDTADEETGNHRPATETGKNSTLLILNRVTTSVVTSPGPPLSPSPSEDARRRQKEPPVYYDYGCV